MASMVPQLVLLIAAAALFILGASKSAFARQASPAVALMALAIAFGLSWVGDPVAGRVDATGSLLLDNLSVYVTRSAIGVSLLFVLLAWPTNADGSSNRSISFGTETGEYFALLLLAVAGVCVAGAANSLATLFLGFELASIPTYVMVTMSRPQEQAQEAGVKYFFLGAASSAVLLLGVAWMFGSTGEVRFDAIADVLAKTITRDATGAIVVPTTVTLAVVLMVLGLSFKLAAVPLHFYAGDVYQGAATPVTAAISFIPKLTALVAILKVLYVAGAGSWLLDPKVIKLLWIMAVLTMTAGNILALWQINVKRVLAYSSVAHSGYILVGVAAAASLSQNADLRAHALGGVAFYVLIYGLTNAAAFGVLQLLPARTNQPALTAETYDDLSGAGLKYPGLGLAMTVACLSLIGIPATVGFFGKLYILRPAIQSEQTMLVWLAVITMLNAAISAAYYLKIVITMWSPSDVGAPLTPVVPERSLPIRAAVTIAVVAVLLLGIVLPLDAQLFNESVMAGATLIGK